MTTLKLFWQMTVRSAAFGVIVGTFGGSAFGAIFANALFVGGLFTQDPSAFTAGDIPRAIFAVLFFGLIGAVVGAMFGIPTGVAVGALNGLLIAGVTRVFFFPPKNLRTYRRVISIVSALFAAFAAWFGFLVIALFYANRSAANIPALAGIFVIPALAAGGYAWFIAPRIVAWYVSGK